MHVGWAFEDFRVVDGGVAICHFDMAPALQRREDHEEIGDAVALIFVVVSRGLSRLGWDRRTGLGNQLLGGLVQAHQRTGGISRLLVGFQHVFHGGDEARAGFGRDHPLPIAVRLERVFLASVRSYCRWPYRRCLIRRLSLRADVGSSARTPPEPASKPERSVWPPPRRRRSAAGRSWGCICASASPRTPPQPVADACERHC